MVGLFEQWETEQQNNSRNTYFKNLVCFDSISAKDNLVQLSDAVWRAFLCVLFRCTGLEKAHVRTAHEWNA